jgi:serine-type D-Ala-D-Ala carboxypeptidase (penicillin-binding protein 5/6)
VLGLLALGLLLLPAPARATAKPPPPDVAARAWILLDADDGTRLAGYAEHRSLPMASTTKLMTAYLALRELPLRRTLVAPAYSALPGESLMGLKAGERVSVHDLMYGLLLPSGNDAAAALAVGVAGSIPAFVREMNAAARDLGLHDTSYANPIGLDAPGEYSSPSDLAKLTLRLRRERIFRRIVDTPRKTLAGADPPTVVNRNDLVAKFPWIDGVKTGYTADAGNVLVASGTRDGVTLLSVVMGAPTEASRDADSLSLLRWGLSLYRPRTPVADGQPLATASLPNGEEGAVRLVAAHAVTSAVRRGEPVDVNVHAPRSVLAPVRRGERLGRAVVSVGGEPVGRSPLLAARSVGVAAESWIAGVDDAAPGPRALVWAVVAAAAGMIVIGIAVAVNRWRRE